MECTCYARSPWPSTSAEADQMVERHATGRVKLAINHQATVRPSLKRMRSMIENGDIGEVILVRGNNKSGRKAGNELMEMGTHVFDRMQFIGGAPQWCFAHLTWRGTPPPLSTSWTLRR